jgi:hypothetical protein
MYAIDLFEADPQSGYVPVNPARPGTRNRKLGNLNLDAIKKSFEQPGTPKPATIQFLNGNSRILTGEEVDAVADYYDTLKTQVEKANFIYRTFISQDKMSNLLFKLKQLNLDLQPPREPSASPQQLTLFQEKKSVDDPKYKDVAVQRAVRQAQANFPTAASDTEAFIKSIMVQQNQDQDNIDRLKGGLTRQKELLSKNSDLDRTQDQTINNLNKEIQNVEKDNNNLQLSLQQMQRANAELQQTLDRMRGKRTEPAPQLGVSVATDKQPAIATAEPVTTPTNVATRQDLAKVAQRQRAIGKTLKNFEPKQLNQPDQQQSVGTGQIDGQDADIYAPLKKTGIPSSIRNRTANSTPATMKKEDLTHGLEESAIPVKQILQGYVVEFDPRSKVVTISQRGQLLKQYKMATPSRRAYDQTVIKFIRSQEDLKYPDDIEDRDVALPMKKMAEGSVFGQQDFDTQMDLAKLKSQLTQPKPAQSAPASAEPQPVPARLSDLQSKKQRIDNLASIKQDIEKLQARATRGGRELPRGLAADLEDYFTTADIDTAYDDMMSKYQRQLGALQQYLGMRKVLWSPKKDVHEMKAKELQEGGPETWTVHFTDGTTTRVRVPSDETDPAKVRAFFANKGKTVKKFDYGFTTEPEAGPGPEPHEPGSGTARSARTGDSLPEGIEDVSDLEFYKELLAVLSIPVGIMGAAVYSKAKNALDKYNAIQIMKALDRKNVVLSREDVQKLRSLIEIFDRAIAKNDGVNAKRIAQDIQELASKSKEATIQEGRAGYNPLTSEKHWHEVERQLSQLINDRTLDPESRAEARQRYLEKRKEAQQKGWAK